MVIIVLRTIADEKVIMAWSVSWYLSFFETQQTRL